MWKLKCEYAGTTNLDRLLKEGWEPFAVTTQDLTTIWLRKFESENCNNMCQECFSPMEKCVCNEVEK